MAALPAGGPRPGSFCEVLCQKQPALSCAHHVEIAVAVEIDDRDLHAAAHAAAEVDQVTNPFDLGRSSSGTALPRRGRYHPVLVPVHAQGFALTRIGSVVRHEPLARDEV